MRMSSSALADLISVRRLVVSSLTTVYVVSRERERRDKKTAERTTAMTLGRPVFFGGTMWRSSIAERSQGSLSRERERRVTRERRASLCGRSRSARSLALSTFSLCDGNKERYCETRTRAESPRERHTACVGRSRSEKSLLVQIMSARLAVVVVVVSAPRSREREREPSNERTNER